MRKTLKEVSQEIIKKEKKEEPVAEEEKEGQEIAIELPSDFTKYLKKTIQANFDFFANRYGKKWKLEDQELDDLTKAYNDLAQKYLPAVIGKFSVELNAIFCTGFIILKRII